MPKVTTNSGVQNRFSLTGPEKETRTHAYHSHILSQKTKKQKRNLNHVTLVDKTNLRQVKELMNLR